MCCGEIRLLDGPFGLSIMPGLPGVIRLCEAMPRRQARELQWRSSRPAPLALSKSDAARDALQRCFVADPSATLACPTTHPCPMHPSVVCHLSPLAPAPSPRWDALDAMLQKAADAGGDAERYRNSTWPDGQWWWWLLPGQQLRLAAAGPQRAGGPRWTKMTCPSISSSD